MKNLIVLLLFATFACTPQKKEIEKAIIIPQPNHLVSIQGNYTLSNDFITSINSDEIKAILEPFQSTIDFKLSENKKSNLKITLNVTETNNESYHLKINKKGVEISANSKKGIFYGLQSLNQLILFSKKEGEKTILPYVSIDDEPRFGWRGILLDESRHFFGVEKVKQLLDLMAMHKLNVFHWHLSDAQGWRIEIKKYPKLTTVGAIGNYSDTDAPAKFYSQEEIKELVKYASDRFIEIIPEIEMPGHASAANRAYPEFSGGGSKSNPEFTFNPGKTETYSYLTDILKEIATLFPAKYIHLGGDEVHFGSESWNTNKDVQQLMKHQQLKNLNEVESYFVRRMADSIKMLNKTVIGWDEIVDHNLSNENSLVMWWRHDLPEKLETALNKKYNVILSPRIPLYFDFVQDENHKWGRKWDGDFVTMKTTYNFPPDTLAGFNQNLQFVKGIQAAIWTEKIKNNKRLDFMIHPRLSALSEAAWTQNENKDMDDFKVRLKSMLSYFDDQGIYYYNPFNSDLNPEPVGVERMKQ